MNNCVNINTAFFLANLWVSSNTFKNKVGEQCDCGGIDELKLIHSFGMLMP